jgi:hypothetical protein
MSGRLRLATAKGRKIQAENRWGRSAPTSAASMSPGSDQTVGAGRRGQSTPNWRPKTMPLVGMGLMQSASKCIEPENIVKFVDVHKLFTWARIHRSRATGGGCDSVQKQG